jgi:T5SS/PEP-CTERM-associated repeat protein
VCNGSSSSPETDTLLIRTNGVSVTYQSARICYTDNCTAYINVSNGGIFQTTTGNINVAFRGNGTLNVSGTGSTATSGAGTAFIGYNANAVGNLNVNSGGTYNCNGGQTLGYSATSSGTMTVNGSASTATFNQTLSIGESGSGATVLQNGSSLTSNGTTYLGKSTGGSGSVNISGGSHWASASTTIGYAASGTGTVSLTGDGSYWADSSSLVIGSTGTGTLTISDGSLVAVAGTLTTGANGVIQLNDGYFALKSVSLLAPSSIASTYHFQVYNGSSYVTATSSNIQTEYFSTSTDWQNSALYSTYSTLDLTGYTLVHENAVPEPATIAFIGGFAALGFAAFRKRRK